MTPTLTIYILMILTVHANQRKSWDKWGIALSGACLIHCVAVFALPLLLPTLNMFVHTPWIHRVFAVFILFVTPMAFVPGYRRHGVSAVLALAVLGVAGILLGVLMDRLVPESLSHGLSIAGSMCLIGAHIQNIRHSHRARCC